MKKISYFQLCVIATLLGLSCFFLLGCAATQVALEHKNLEVHSKMSDTIFLDIENGFERTIYIDIRNTSDKDIDLRGLIENKLKAKGYKIIHNPKKAFYILQANILYVGKANPSALRESLAAGYGGPLAGALIGYAATGSGRTAAVGGLIGGAAEVIAGSLVKNVTYSIITDIQISEKSSTVVSQSTSSKLHQGKSTTVTQKTSSKRKWKKYQTRVASTANKVNLKFADALPVLKESMSKAISGIF